MNTSILSHPNPNIPAKTDYWQGYDQYQECAVTHDWLSPEEYASMTDAERRGYEAAARAEADAGTYVYLANVNSFGDLTGGAA